LLGKSDCDHCNEFTEELHTFLAADTTYADVRFGKILLDRGGLASFKRANPWLADIDVLPYTLIYRGRQKGRRIRRRRHQPPGIQTRARTLRDSLTAAWMSKASEGLRGRTQQPLDQTA
jgi:hypothetical protein